VAKRVVLGMLVVILTGLALAAVAGHRPDEGPTIMTLTSRHGVHAGDLLVVLGWAIGVGSCAWLWRRT
jgi:hypothetical protein